MDTYAQDVTWTDHMSALSPDTLPAKAHEDKPGTCLSVVDIGRGTGSGADGAVSTGEFDEHGVDTARQSVLLIGDSMLDGIGSRLVDYTSANGYELHTFIWYGSNSKHWATTHDLEYLIDRYRPTFIVMSLGTNDLGYSDYSRREGWIRTIVEKFGSIPFVWIGPLPLSRRGMTNRHIVSVMRECIGADRFYDSSDTRCARVDGVHPTYAGAAKWVDSIAKWMSTPGLTPHPIRMDYPHVKARFRADEKHTLKYRGRI